MFLIHGDLWANNCLFDKDLNCILLDWQFTATGNVLTDFGLMAYLSMDSSGIIVNVINVNLNVKMLLLISIQKQAPILMTWLTTTSANFNKLALNCTWTHLCHGREKSSEERPNQLDFSSLFCGPWPAMNWWKSIRPWRTESIGSFRSAFLRHHNCLTNYTI